MAKNMHSRQKPLATMAEVYWRRTFYRKATIMSFTSRPCANTFCRTSHDPHPDLKKILLSEQPADFQQDNRAWEAQRRAIKSLADQTGAEVVKNSLMVSLDCSFHNVLLLFWKHLSHHHISFLDKQHLEEQQRILCELNKELTRSAENAEALLESSEAEKQALILKNTDMEKENNRLGSKLELQAYQLEVCRKQLKAYEDAEANQTDNDRALAAMKQVSAITGVNATFATKDAKFHSQTIVDTDCFEPTPMRRGHDSRDPRRLDDASFDSPGRSNLYSSQPYPFSSTTRRRTTERRNDRARPDANLQDRFENVPESPLRRGYEDRHQSSSRPQWPPSSSRAAGYAPPFYTNGSRHDGSTGYASHDSARSRSQGPSQFDADAYRQDGSTGYASHDSARSRSQGPSQFDADAYRQDGSTGYASQGGARSHSQGPSQFDADAYRQDGSTGYASQGARSQGRSQFSKAVLVLRALLNLMPMRIAKMALQDMPPKAVLVPIVPRSMKNLSPPRRLIRWNEESWCLFGRSGIGARGAVSLE